MTKEKDSIISRDSVLTDQQTRMLRSVLDLIIPPDANARMPGASQIDVVSYINEMGAEQAAAVGQGLDALALFVTDSEQQQGHRLDEPGRIKAIEQFATSRQDVWPILVLTIYSCYYQDPQVMVALGMGSQPPFPGGNEVASGDLSLLDQVRQRKPFYRQ